MAAHKSVSETPSAVLSALSALNITESNNAISNTAVSIAATSNAATSNTITSSTTDLRLQNFPLPREIRDHIYGYLLHSDYTRIARESKTGDKKGSISRQAYKFHTNILAVNKAIHEESQEFLYKNNVFVVVSADWHLHGFLPGESLFSRNFWTPLVTETHAAKMRHHSLRLHLTKGKNAEFDRFDESTGSRTQAPIQSCVVMANDFHALCLTLRCHVIQYPGFSILVEDEAMVPPPRDLAVVGLDEHDGTLEKSSRLQIQFRATPFRTRDVDMQSKMFDLLRQVASAGLRVTFDGVLPEHIDRAQKTKDAMGPTLISRQASHWDSLEVLCKAKKLMDDNMCAGELYLAEKSYSLIIGDTFRLLKLASERNSLHSFSPAVHAANVLTLDLALTLSYLQMRLGRQHELKNTTMYLLEVSKSLNRSVIQFGETTSTTPESAGAACLHLALLTKMYLEKMRYPNRPSSIFVRDMVEALTEHQQLPYHAHDLAILSKVPDQGDTALQHLPLHKCSISVLPPRRFSYHEFPGVPKKPKNIVGIQNLDSLRRLDHETKMDINQTQRQYGQKVTTWE